MKSLCSVILMLITSISFSQVAGIGGVIMEDSVYFGQPLHYQLNIQSNTLPTNAEIILDLSKIENLNYKTDTTLFDQYADITITENATLSKFISNNVLKAPLNEITLPLSETLEIYALSIGNLYFPDPMVRVKGDTLNPYLNGDIALVLPPEGIAMDSLGMINDIKPIIEVPFSIMDYLWYILGGIVFLGMVWYFLNRKKNVEIAEAEEPKIEEVKLPAHEIALGALRKLEAEAPWQHNKIKEYQSELTYIIREYLENRFGINALETTTSSIIEEVKNQELSQDQRNELTEVLTVADLVKFAKATPTAELHEQFLHKAFAFVNSTKTIDHV